MHISGGTTRMLSFSVLIDLTLPIAEQNNQELSYLVNFGEIALHQL